MRASILCVAIAGLARAALPAVAQTAAGETGPTASTAVVRPGDVIRVTVWRKPELSGEFDVSADGTLADPFYMAVTVGGLPFQEAAGRIRAYVERFETAPRVLVEPLFRVAVGGEVQHPDVYTFGSFTTVAQTVLHAGGPTERGDLGRVWLHRGGERIRVDLKGLDDPLGDTTIRSGDAVMVEGARPFFRDVVLPTLFAIGAASSVARLFIR